MNKLYKGTKMFKKISLLLMLSLSTTAFAADVVIPSKLSKDDIAGNIFSHPSMIRTPKENGETLDVRNMLSSDEKFESGMFKAGKSRFEINEPYGVDEFMYFLEGSVKLTSKDGSVQVINAGEAVTVPREWMGIWETDGYMKIYVIFTPEK